MRTTYLSVFQALSWAERQDYGGPLEKLLMLRICSASVPEGGEYQYLPLEYSDLATYSFASAQDCADALEELRRRGLVVIGAAGPSGVELAIPWWMHDHEFLTLAKAKKLEIDFRALATKCQEHRCWYCGESFGEATPHLEHQVPRVRGGEDITENLVVACAQCNLSKGPKTVTEFRSARAALAGKKTFRFWGESRA